MGFFTIFVPEGLSEAEYRLALRSGPGWVSSRRRHHIEMLRSAEFRDVEEIDLTAEFLETARAWRRGFDRFAAEIIAADGEEIFRERRAEGMAQLRAIEAGVLRRAMFLADR
jgi:hypothetical protein